VGSDLRGRVIVLFRPLDKRELEREGEEFADLVWPALVLDDGTLVYAAKKTGKDESGRSKYGPALLFGQRVSKTKGTSGRVGDMERVVFNMTVADVKLSQNEGEA
jgi:hypothetical protein